MSIYLTSLDYDTFKSYRISKKIFVLIFLLNEGYSKPENFFSHFSSFLNFWFWHLEKKYAHVIDRLHPLKNRYGM